MKSRAREERPINESRSNPQSGSHQGPAVAEARSQALTKAEKQERQIDKLIMTACQVVGTQSREVADRTIVQVGEALVFPKPKEVDETLVTALGAMAEMAPQNVTEAMLAGQMIAVNDAIFMFLKRATVQNQPSELVDANVVRATRLMRVFNEQLEAMRRLKGKAGQQKVTVEHVHIHEGGQAIVGAVNHSTTGGGG